MPIPQALAIHPSEQQQSLLQQIARSRTQPHRLVQQAQVLLLAFEGLNNLSTGQKLKNAQDLVGFLFEIKHNVSQMIEAVAEDAF